jgi:hypothetical protein
MWRDLDRALRALVMKVGTGVYSCSVGETKYKIIIIKDQEDD